MEQLLIAILSALVGGYIGYRLSTSGERWKDKKKLISGFSGSLRKTLPNIREGLDNAYLFSSDLTGYFSLINENELELCYQELPRKVKTHIQATSDSLNSFVAEFRRLSKHVLKYFENMTDRKGQGSEKLNTIVATRLLCLDREEIPTEKTVVNFPRDNRGHFAQVQCQPQQLIEIWDLGEQGNSTTLKEKRLEALLNLNKLDEMLAKLHKA